MTSEEQTFARQSQFLLDSHRLADMAIDLGGERGGPLLLSAALLALERTVGIDQALDLARIWAESLDVAAWQDGSSGRH